VSAEAAARALVQGLEALVAHTRAQGAALQAGELERYAELLERREQQLVALGISDEPGSSAAGMLANASELTRRAAARALTQIATLDAEQRAVLEAERRAVLEELPGLDAGRRAAAAYGAQGHERGPGAAYVDAAS
jgi:hypothetical protein